MFWKKKKIDIEFPGNDHDSRSAYRVRPSGERPIVLKIAGHSFFVLNVSGTGCSFRSHLFKEGVSISGALTIESEETVFPVTLRVVTRQRDICRCEFIKIPENGRNSIHHYVLETQKKQIRR